MEMLLKMQGAPEDVIQVLVAKGYFKTKTEAVRAGVMGLGEKYGLGDPKALELAKVALKMETEHAEMKAGGKKYLSEKQALGKYKKLLKNK